jgi:sulfate adenylyltransferase
MPDLIAPHGGRKEPVTRIVADAQLAEFRKSAGSLNKVPVSDADLSSLCRFGDGRLTPLVGPMDQATFNRMLDEEVILEAGKKYAWTIPISFPIDKSLAGSLKTGETVALVSSKNDVVGTLKSSDIFPFEKQRYLKSVYAMERTDHPGGHVVMDDPRDMLLGGEVWVLPQPKHPEYSQFVLSPREARAVFQQKAGKGCRFPDAQSSAARPRVRPGPRHGVSRGFDQRARAAREAARGCVAGSAHHAAGDGADLGREHAREIV